jgi:hypothetical protein
MKVTKLFLCFLISFFCFSTTYQVLQFTNSPQSKNITEKSFKVYYKNNLLFIKGYNVNGVLQIYSIIGNVVLEINIQDLSNLSIPVNLIKHNMYIVRIKTADNTIFSHKIVAQ